MTPSSLLDALRTRGARVRALPGGKIGVQPRAVLDDTLRAAIHRHRAELVALLSRTTFGDGDMAELRHRHDHDLTPAERDRLRDEATDGNPLAAAIIEAVACAPEPLAWRVYSRRFGRELWVARDRDALAAVAEDGLPVLLAEDLQRIRTWDDRRLSDALDALALWPGTRLVGGTA